MSHTVIEGDCLKSLKKLEDNSVDSLVTDPPAGIAFMGKDWDKDKGGRTAWVQWMTEVMSECYRVLKPGAHGFVWALPRTSHWTAWALEDAGLEVRDSVHHLFGSGFPKSLDVSKAIDKMHGAEREVIGKYKHPDGKTRNSKGGFKESANTYGVGEIPFERPETAPSTPDAKQWNGWGTALKPAHEVWWLVRKPLSEKTVAKNVLKHGTGAINVDGCRVETIDNLNGGAYSPGERSRSESAWGGGVGGGVMRGAKKEFEQPQGRFPANLIVSGDAREVLDEQSGQLSQVGGPKKTTHDDGMFGIGTPGRIYREDNRGASRFFFDGADPFLYCAKSSKKDRNSGGAVNNTHPTCKSQKLMRYLCKMITPPNGTVLDPFMGSGSTGVAALAEGFSFIGIEQEKEYADIARARLEYGKLEQEGQLSLIK